MVIVEESQVPPLVLGLVLAIGIIIAATAIIFLTATNVADANRVYWYITRSAGMTAYLLLSLTTLLGVSSSTAMWDRLRARKLIAHVHQFASLLIAPFLALHLWGLSMDKDVPFTWTQIFVPLTSTYRPLPTSLGVLALYGLVSVVLTSFLKARLGQRVWRTIHYLAFPSFIFVTAHGLLAGTDGRSVWAVMIYLVPSVLFLWIFLRRLQAFE